MIDYYSITAAQAEAEMAALVELIVDAVASGASIGFMPPLEEEQARGYWREVIAAGTAPDVADRAIRLGGTTLVQPVRSAGLKAEPPPT